LIDQSISMMRDLAIASAFVLFAGSMPAALALAPKSGAPVAVIASPWAEDGAALRIVAAADGRVIGAAHDGEIAVATSTSDDFVSRLYQSGAALVLDGAALAACLTVAGEHPFSAKRTAL
jgi:hypothetical protein